MKNEIYICLLNRYVGAFNPSSWEITYAQRNEFTTFIQETIKKNPDAKIRCVLNEGLEEIIKNKIEYDKKNLSIKNVKDIER